MSDTNLHMDSGLLQKYFEGKLSKSESDSVSALLEKDEFYREAFLGLNAQEFAVVEKISNSVNTKLRKVIAPPPLYMRWQIWLSVFIGLIAITSFVLIYDFNTNDSGKKAVASNETNKKKERKNKPEIKHRPKTVAVHSFYMEEDEKTSQEYETTMDFKSQKTSENIIKETKTGESEKTNSTDEKSQVQNGPDENKTDEKKNNIIKTDNPNTIDAGKKTYRIRVEDVAVINTQNLADKEASSGESRDNMDVKNPNIGSDLTKKKNVSYNLEDMPQYKGGTEALAAYVKGKIAIKSYNLKESSVSTVVEFVVTSKGKVEDIKFQTPLDPAMEKDIREVLSAVTFTPGKKSGKKGSMFYMMAMMFE